MALWPSNRAIVWTGARAEEAGIHLHTYDDAGRQLHDDTYSSVMVDGRLVDEILLRLLCVQRALAHHGNQVVAGDCDSCGEALVSRPVGPFLQPTTAHECACGAAVRTRRRVFMNPLAAFT